MADDVTLSAGTADGAILATDDVATKHYQRVKLTDGTADSTTVIAAGGGTEATALRVTVASDSTGVLTVDGTVTANLSATDNAVLDSIATATVATQAAVEGTLTVAAHAVTNPGTFAVQEDGAALAALQLLDDIVATDDTSTHATGTTKGAVIMAAATPTDGSVGANDLGALAMSLDRRLHVDAQIVGTDAALDVSGATVTVDGSGVTQPVSGTVTANAGTGPWPVTDNGGSLTVDNSSLSVTGGGTELGALRVTIASDSTGTVSVDDGGGALTVDGTVAVSGTVTVDGSAVTQPVSNAGLTELAAAINTSRLDVTLPTTPTANLATVAGAVAGTEMQVDVVAALPAGTNAIGKLAANSGVDIGDVDVTSIAAGTNVIGDVGLSGARTSGGTTIFRSIDLDESEEEVKATGGQVYWIHCMNLAASARYLKFYNATAATVVVGTTVPVMTFPIPTQGDTNGAGFALSVPNGIAFATAITVAATTGIADADTGAPGANEVIVNLGFA